MFGGKSKSRKSNSTLSSWVSFVKMVAKDEGISYKDAMTRASKRKHEWKGHNGTKKHYKGGSASANSITAAALGPLNNVVSALTKGPTPSTPTPSVASKPATQTGGRKKRRKGRKSSRR